MASIVIDPQLKEVIGRMQTSLKRVTYGGRHDRHGVFCARILYEAQLQALLGLAVRLYNEKDTINSEGEPAHSAASAQLLSGVQQSMLCKSRIFRHIADGMDADSAKTIAQTCLKPEQLLCGCP